MLLVYHQQLGLYYDYFRWPTGWPPGGGGLIRKKNRKEEIVEVLEEVVQELPKAPVKVLKEKLKVRNLIYEKEYRDILREAIKYEIKQRHEIEDEESLIMLL